jgi:hypothetical protein
MLERIDDLNAGLTGLRATGTVTVEDYERVVIPMLENARREGRRLRFLFQFDSGFDGFTAGAAWKDLKVGWKYLRLFERCAVASDRDWIQAGATVVGAVLPCPVRVFGTSELEKAIEWLRGPPESSLDFQILQERGVVVVQPRGKLEAADFDRLEAEVDDWIDGHGDGLKGLVVHTREFPGWEDLGSALRHIRFVRDHHRQIPRVAFASDSRVAALAPMLAQHFVKAEIERFDWDSLDDAIHWAGGGTPASKPPAA